MGAVVVSQNVSVEMIFVDGLAKEMKTVEKNYFTNRDKLFM